MKLKKGIVILIIIVLIYIIYDRKIINFFENEENVDKIKDEERNEDYKVYIGMGIDKIIKFLNKKMINDDKKYYSITIDDSTPKYLINLDKRTDRMNTTSYLLKKHGYNNISRFSAINGKNISFDILNKLVDKDSIEPIYKNKRTNHDQLSIGAVGCYLSHVKLWNKIENDKYDYAIIFEDDTNPTININDLNKILSKSPDDWDIILLGGMYNLKKNFMNPVFYKVNQFFCLHAYIINKNAIKKIKPYLYPLRVQVDWVLSNMSTDNKLNIYVIKNSNWNQNTEVNSTDIQTPLIINN